MRLILLILSFISIFTGLARAETLLPEQRVIVYRDADFPGGDVQSVRDISLNGCESACIGRADCRAFTYNSRAAACFLKDHVDSVEAYVGAFSAEIRPIPQPLRDAAETRAATLDFLKPSDLSYAAGLAHDLPYQYMAGGDDIAYSTPPHAKPKPMPCCRGRCRAWRAKPHSPMPQRIGLILPGSAMRRP
ncbi:MAG: PAN/Apple domain-containing protein [Maritimibacter sp.]